MKQLQLQQVDRGIYERLRLVLVENGYLPDRTLLNDATAWENALEAVRSSGKTPILLYGVGPWNAREARYNSIVIDRTQRRLSPLGFDGRKTLVFQNTHYEEQQAPDETAELAYSITALGKTADDERTMQELIYQAFGVDKTMVGYDQNRTPTEETFTLFRLQVVNTNGEDFVETVYTYRTSALLLEETVISPHNISPITDIDFTTANI